MICEIRLLCVYSQDTLVSRASPSKVPFPRLSMEYRCSLTDNAQKVQNIRYWPLINIASTPTHMTFRVMATKTTRRTVSPLMALVILHIIGQETQKMQKMKQSMTFTVG